MLGKKLSHGFSKAFLEASAIEGAENCGAGPRKYFTRTRRVRSGFVREYYGIGPFAELKALELAQERDRLGRTARWRNLRLNLEQADKLVISFCARTEFLLGATLAATGHHNHRGVWRKRQKAGFIHGSGKPLPGDIRGLIHQAQTGRVDAIEALKACAHCLSAGRQAHRVGLRQPRPLDHPRLGPSHGKGRLQLAMHRHT